MIKFNKTFCITKILKQKLSDTWNHYSNFIIPMCCNPAALLYSFDRETCCDHRRQHHLPTIPAALCSEAAYYNSSSPAPSPFPLPAPPPPLTQPPTSGLPPCSIVAVAGKIAMENQPPILRV